MIVHERLEDYETEGRLGHEFRYRLAAGFCEGTVLDAACGTGYGKRFLTYDRYLGVDRAAPFRAGFERADLHSWQPDFGFDTALSFETLEHLEDYSHFVSILKLARRFILASVPVVPTMDENPWHLHNFVPGDLERIFNDDVWEPYQVVLQPSEVSEIAVFRRR